MPDQTSQTTNPALKSLDEAEFMVTSARNVRQEVSDEVVNLTDLFNPAPPVEKRSAEQWTTVQDDVIGILQGSKGYVRDKDQTFRLHRARARSLSAERPDRLATLGRFYSDMRLLIEASYGPEYLPVLGLDAPRAGSRIAVREQLTEVSERMDDDGQIAQMPEPRPGRTPIDFKATAAAIRAVVEEFEAYLEEIKDLRRTIKKLALERRLALKLHRRVYANVGRILEGFMRLANLDDLARQLRVKTPSRSSGSTETEPPPDSTPEPPATSDETEETSTA